MSVRIRMKKMGRTHRPFFRICAIDKRAPRDGRALEELGTYDPSIADTDARAVLNKERINYWLSVGAQPSEKVAVLIKKYGAGGTHADAQAAALEKLAQAPVIPDPGEPASLPKSAEPEAPAEQAKPDEEAKTEEAKTEEASADAPKADQAELPKQGETPEAKIDQEKASEDETTVEQGAAEAAAEAEKKE